MLRLIVLVLLLSTSAESAFAEAPLPSKVVIIQGASLPFKLVDLNAPGAMKRVRETNPEHYEKIQEIIRGLKTRSARDVPGWIRTSFKAKRVLYSDILLTSAPAQRDLSFVLDDMSYYIRVYVSKGPGSANVRAPADDQWER